jgi:MoaA/NifB/PqqE/SkfB family radical SAM enzyme
MNQIFCAAPWRGLHINPRGDVKTCCAGDPNMLGNLNDQSIEQVLHGPIMQEIRQTIQSGRLHEQYCYNCIQAERYGRSERDWHNGVNPDFDCQLAGDLEHVPTLIDVRWNITCNLSCNYCGDKCSSKWADLKRIPFRSGTRPYYEQVCDYLEQHRANIKQVALVGGEPLLLKENERLLDVIPDDCLVTLITNLSVDLSTNKIFQKLSTRTRVGWSCSFDNIGTRFEYVRHGGHWDLICKNINLIKSTTSHEMGIHAVYNLYNATRLTEFVDWAKQQGLTTQWQSLYDPVCLDPLRLGSTIKDLAIRELDVVLSRSDLTHGERGFLTTARNNYEHPHDPVPIAELMEHVDQIETCYHPDQKGGFLRLWPEFEPLLNTNYVTS